MNKKKIVFGIESTEGGSLKHVKYLVNNLDRSLFDITLILSTSRGSVDEDIRKIKEQGITVRLLPMRRGLHFYDVWCLLKLFLLMRREQYDVVHAHSTKAGFLFRIAAWLNGVPLVLYTPHCFYFQAFPEGIRKKLIITLERFLTRFTDYIIVNENEKKAAREARLCHEGKFLIINNAIPLEHDEANIQRKLVKQLFNVHSSRVVAGIGRLTEQKDWRTFVFAAQEVLKQCPDTTFLIVGKGEKEQEIRKLIIELNLTEKVILTGYIHDVQNIYAIADILASTSLWEGLPYVFLEAMHAAIPVIATDLDFDFIIRNGDNGYILPKKDPCAFAQRICSLLSAPHLLENNGASARETVRTDKYSFETFLSTHRYIYLSLGDESTSAWHHLLNIQQPKAHEIEEASQSKVN